jgi:hypothetical protein
MPLEDSYDWYCRYYKNAYGRDYPVSRVTWADWCKSDNHPHLGKQDTDITTEQRDGWTYQTD